MNQKTKYITGIVLSVLVICALTIPAFALTESDVQSQVSASGKEGVAGNLFVWFLCAVAFLKISQKIDSFMQGLGINVGHTGGSMLAEAMLAARSIAAARGVAGRGRGGNAGRAGSTGGGDSNTFLQGGLAGVANRSFYNGAYRNATGTGSGGVGGMAFRASMTKGGDIANNVISRIATGGAGSGDVVSSNMAADALKSYMGYCRLQHSKELRSFPVSEIFDTEADNHRAMASGFRNLQEQLAEVDALSLLESAKQQYNGVARLGIEAMQLKFIGLSNTDIAAYYGIKANYLGAAVHRAAERLRNNAEFLNSLEYEPLKKSSKAS